jgi:uncharacterized protein (TIGR00369 family)
MTSPAGLTEAEQMLRRDWFRRHWETNLPFNRLCRISVRHWDSDRVELVASYADELSAHPGIFHGGVLATLIDTAGSGAVMAGHDYNRGSRLSTATLSIQYLSVAKGEDVVAIARAVKRGRTVHVADADITGVTTGKLLARGQVTVTIEGERPGLLGPLPGDGASDLEFASSRSLPDPG